MRVLVRLLLLAGVAAAIALMVRLPLAHRVALHIAPDVQELAEASRRIAPRAAILPLAPPTAAPILPFVPPASHTPIVPAPLHKHAKVIASASPTITRKQLEDAIATRLDGARAALVRDDAGHPVGLRLSGVGKLAPFGVHDGDVLISANGFPLRTSDEALAALGKLQDAKRVVVSLRRGASMYSVPVELID